MSLPQDIDPIYQMAALFATKNRHYRLLAGVSRQLMVVRCSSYVVAAVDDSSPMFSFIAVVNMFKFIVQR